MHTSSMMSLERKPRECDIIGLVQDAPDFSEVVPGCLSEHTIFTLIKGVAEAVHPIRNVDGESKDAVFRDRNILGPKIKSTVI